MLFSDRLRQFTGVFGVIGVGIAFSLQEVIPSLRVVLQFPSVSFPGQAIAFS
ncbi:hypothetical protein RintRC_1075 [Richelia intracellularis]|nr:hypothetical protein RintRC_1075 [Richelia intracellularis]